MDLIKYLVTLLIYFLTIRVNSYRILGVFPLAFRSHNIFFEALMKGLTKRGHQVDVITHYELSNPPENYTTILNLANLDFPFPATTFDSIKAGFHLLTNPIKRLTEIYGVHMCNLMGHKKMQDIIRNLPTDPSYDLVIVEGYGFSCFYGIGRLLNVPIVTVTPSAEFPWISRQIGNPLSTAFVPTFLSPRMKIKTFWDRLYNTVRSHIDINIFFTITNRPETEAMRKFLSPDMPTVREVERSVALSIVNTHHTIQGVRPKTQAFIEVGGLHIEESNSAFTMELKQWMDKSKNGVVYISFGSILPIETLPRKTMLAIYSSLSKLGSINVLLKATKGHKFPAGIPQNVKITTWAPQLAVLQHNNTRAFITHGGIHSMQEAIYCGIPVIGIPLIYDQHQNVAIFVNKKMGIQLNYDEITEKSLDEALDAILNDPKYREAVKNHSRIFRDGPMSPMNTAIYWIEYVTRHGADSLRSPATYLYWWQVDLLDVYGFLLICLILLLYLISFIFKVTFKWCFKKTEKLQLKID